MKKIFKATDKEKKKRRRRSNLEDVDQTILDIRENKERARRKALTVLKWVFFPFTAVWLLFKYIFTMQKIRLTTKTTLIFTVIFGALIAVYVMVVVGYLKGYLEKTDVDTEGFIPALTLISAGAGVAFLFIGAATGAIVGHAMLRPVRKIITEIDGIDGENLSLRLRSVDSQDEIEELVSRINEMLGSLEESFERQSNFVSDASHELKTPLSVISGYNGVLERWGKNDPAVLDEALAAIRRESAYMAKIIDQMLLLARLGRFNMHKQDGDIVSVVSQIVKTYELTAEDSKFTFIAEDEVFAQCDKTLLTEAVRAIIDNAIKYSPWGADITVTVKGGDEDASISVADKGIGIDEDDIPYIFDRFYRCDKTRGREKGSGLGLTICKNIVEMMDGQIFVKSVKDEGTEFTIKLERE